MSRLSTSTRTSDSACESSGSGAVGAWVVDLLRRRPPAADLAVCAGDLLLDFLGCASAGSSVLPERWPRSSASRLAVAAHAEDRDDVHYASLTHPGGVVWPVIAATAHEGQSGARLVGAAWLGYEVMVSLALALGTSHRRAWHATATAGTVAAAAVAADLLSEEPHVLTNAISHALSVAGGLAQPLRERSGTALVHRAHAVEAGISCALAADSGLDGASSILEGVDGAIGARRPRALRDFADQDASIALLFDHRAPWAIQRTSVRTHAASGFCQAPIDAAVALGRVSIEDVRTVRVRVSEAAAQAAGNPAPIDSAEAWWSIPHAVAVCLTTGSAATLEAGFDASSEVRDLRRRVELTIAAGEGEAELEVVGARGMRRTAKAHVHASERELLGKFARLTGSDGQRELASAHGLAYADDGARELAALIRATGRGDEPSVCAEANSARDRDGKSSTNQRWKIGG